MDFSEDELKQIFKIFKDESEEHLAVINKCLLDLEKKPDDIDLISELFREAHTIKGSARMLDVVSIQNLAHKMEDLLGLAKDNITNITPEMIDILCKGVDIITQILGKLEYNTLDYFDENSEKLANDIENIKQSILDEEKEKEKEKEKNTNLQNTDTDADTDTDIRPELIFNQKKTNIEPEIIITNTDTSNNNDVSQVNNSSDDIIIINKNTDTTSGVDNNILNDSTSYFSIISHYISQLDNKYQKDNAINEIISIINDAKKTETNTNKQEILNLITNSLNYIKSNNILPSNEIVNAVKDALNSTFDPNSKEDFMLVIQRLNILKQILELSNENEKLFVLPQQTTVQNPPQKNNFNKQNDAQSIAQNYDTGIIKTLRVDTKKLDKLESQVEELIILKIKNKQKLKNINNLMTELSELQKNISKYSILPKSNDKKQLFQQIPSGETIILKNLQNQIEKTTEKINDLYQQLDLFQKNFLNDDIHFNFLTDEIENTVKSIRILPLATVFHMFPRMVRDIARMQGKQVDIIISGSETSADKTIVEEVKSPLIHIIRNSVDHGIELPDERIAKGKNPTGKILLNSYHSGNSITIEVIDDGQGLNLDKIKEKVLKQNLLSEEELNQLTESQIINLIFWPGFSTGEKVTEISGRGVGLDVVRTKINQLGGKVSVQSNIDAGFKIIIKIPITLATVKALLIRCNQQIYAISSSYVKTVSLLNEDEIYNKEGKPHIIYNDKSIKLVKLSELLNLFDINTKKDLNSKKHNIIVTQIEDSILAIEVDEFIKTEEILQKKLNPPLTKVKNISGVASLSTGEACLILNMDDIVNSSISSTELQKNSTILTLPNKKNTVANILIVDDSYTTITLEKNILKSAGYNVITAGNGEEALKKLAFENIDMVITDLEMPIMNGIELIKRIRNKNNTIPIIVVTARADESIKNDCFNIKANNMIVKKDFSKTLFLDKIKQFI